MNEIREEATVISTSARISSETAAALREQRLRLSLLVGREISNDELIQAMHDIFVQQPITTILGAVRP